MFHTSGALIYFTVLSVMKILTIGMLTTSVPKKALNISAFLARRDVVWHGLILHA